MSSDSSHLHFFGRRRERVVAGASSLVIAVGICSLRGFETLTGQILNLR